MVLGSHETEIIYRRLTRSIEERENANGGGVRIIGESDMDQGFISTLRAIPI